MKRVLITVSEALGKELAALLKADFEVRVCRQWESFMPQWVLWCPEVAVIDLSLAGSNYRDILNICLKRHTAVVLLTPLLDEKFLQEAEQSGVACILRIPCAANTIAARIRSLLTAPLGSSFNQ